MTPTSVEGSQSPSPVLQELVTHVPPFITTASELPVIPGSGLTRRLVTSLPKDFPATGVILEYVLEGDNRLDAKILASTAARCLQKELGISGSGELPSTYRALKDQGLDLTPIQRNGKSRRAGSKVSSVPTTTNLSSARSIVFSTRRSRERKRNHLSL